VEPCSGVLNWFPLSLTLIEYHNWDSCVKMCASCEIGWRAWNGLIGGLAWSDTLDRLEGS